MSRRHEVRRPPGSSWNCASASSTFLSRSSSPSPADSRAVDGGPGDRRGGESRHGERRRERIARRLLPASMMGGCACSSPPPSLAPIATVGGLAQAAAGLVAELRRQGVDVDVVMPDYGGIELADRGDPRSLGSRMGRTGPRSHRACTPTSARSASSTRRDLARSHPYLQPDGHGWPDNDRRFLTFCQAIAAIADVDRHPTSSISTTGTPAPHSPPSTARSPACCPCTTSPTRVSPTVRGCRHLGPRGWHYEWFGGTNPLCGAIALADAIVAVSPTHASGDPHARRRIRPRRRLAPSLGGRQRDPQRHRHGRCGTRRPMRRWWPTTAASTKTPERAAGPGRQPGGDPRAGRVSPTTTCRSPWSSPG